MPDEPDPESRVIETLTLAQDFDNEVLLGPGDDAAILRGGRVLTMDTLVEGVHWDHRFTAEDLGARLFAVNASDIGAMGARPTWALLALTLPAPLDQAWVQDFARGLRGALGRVPLLGGDTTRGPARVLTLTLGGQLHHPPLRRDGASPGQDLWVSGTLGDAGAAFEHGFPELWSRLARPAPPLELGPALAEAGLASAAMDLSDGLAIDLPRLCVASGCGATLVPERLPCSEALARRLPPEQRQRLQLAWGDDYELLFAADPGRRAAIEALGRALGLRLTRIGHTTEGPPRPSLEHGDWPRGFSHFPRDA